VLLPDGDLASGAVERYWGRDRYSLVICGAEKAALVEYVTPEEEKAASLLGRLRLLTAQ